jgi:hypothetical protein
MAWITLTEADILAVLSGPELEGYREAALGDVQADPVQPEIENVIEEIRGHIAACTRNVLGPAGTIPSRLKSTALDLLAVRIPARVGKAPKKVREDAAERAQARLILVGKCQFDIGETPEPGPEQPTGGETPSFSGRPRRDARHERSGL